MSTVALLASMQIAAGGGTSYANTGGSGDRTGIVTVTASSSTLATHSDPYPELVDGNQADHTTWFIIGALSGSVFVRFDFGSSKVIDEAKFYQETSATQGTWQWQGSADASSWTNIGSSFGLGGATTQTITALSGNSSSYRYYQIIGVSGSTDSGPYISEFEFKISA